MQRPTAETMRVLGDSEGGGYTLEAYDGQLYHGKPSLVGKHRAGDVEMVGFLSPKSRREPLILTGWNKTTKRLPLLIGSVPAYLQGLWPQAEGLPQLGHTNADSGFFPPNWPGITGLNTEILIPLSPPNTSYLYRGFVHWTINTGTGYAFSHWVPTGDGWSLAILLGTLYGPAGDTLVLGQYDIEDHGGALSQGDSGYGGGTDHGGLALHYLRAANCLLQFGPLTHPTGRLDAYVINLNTGAVTKSVAPKLLIHTSVGHHDVLIGWWGGDGSPSYYSDSDVKILRLIGDRLQAKATVPATSLATGADLYACHPDNSRARGRWPWRPVTNGEGKVLEGEFALAAISATEGSVTFGPGDTIEGVPDPMTVYPIMESTYLDLSWVSPSGAVARIYTNTVLASSASINYDSFSWFEGVVAYPPPDISVTTQLQLGWAGEGDVRTFVSVAVSDEFPSGARVVHGPILNQAEHPHVLLPMSGRNTLTRSDGNDVFEFSPPTPHQPTGAISSRGHLALCFAEPVYEIAGSSDFNSFFRYPTSPGVYTEERWRLPKRRTYYRTWLVHVLPDGFVVRVDISQNLTGLLDTYALETPREYEARPLLDQIWQCVPCDTANAEALQCVALLRDWRDQDTLGPSEARPVLQLRNYDSIDAAEALRVELMPTDRFEDGSPRFAKCLFGRPQLYHGVDPNLYPWIDVVCQYRNRTSADDDIGDPDTQICRVTQLRWDADHPTLADAVVGTLEVAGLGLPEQAVEGMGYILGTPVLQVNETGYSFQ